ADALCPSDTADHGKSRRCQLGHVISCIQSQLNTWDMYTDYQGTDQCADDQCGPRSATCQCSSVPRTHQCHISVHITSMPHISAHLSCLSMSPISAVNQCHLSVPPNSAIYQCHVSVLPFSAHQ
ncbi:unnamed protein product, partial [Staurois parvus]